MRYTGLRARCQLPGSACQYAVGYHLALRALLLKEESGGLLEMSTDVLMLSIKQLQKTK